MKTLLQLEEKVPTLSRKSRKGVWTVKKDTPDIQEIERLLGIDSVRPIPLTPSDEEDTKEKETELRDWYEYELKKFFESGKIE
ncbi:hypothetical protein COD20_27000 [Bacillus cereus]|uniref:hypothetical protein n=1 Tax=Bacillus cereus TaxID=1396 RepID=UPI000BF63D29|nr:hypothetical protein [Bacillus cereus]PFQ62882.1 hypothetical protein COK18_18380 [Bacillus cereus]PGT97324.1 hypothetical protein COD20_27000 [Bacillus cereus]